MSKRKFIYNVATLALTAWNTTRLVEALHDQSNEIARKVTMEIAKQKARARREGADAVAGITRDVFAELIDTPPPRVGEGEGPIVPIDEMMLGDAIGRVVERTLA